VKLTKFAMTACLAVTLTGTLSLFAAEDAPPEHVKWMKDLGASMGQIRKGVDVEANANKIAAISADVKAWWAKRTSDVAAKTCDEMIAGAKALATAAKAEDKAGVGAGNKMIGAGCKGCHDAHREKISDTEYKIK
jgi:cytochrome c556